MRVKGEVVFPNNIRQLRLRKGLTQAPLGRLMEPPIGESTISKMESGERRLTNLQLANLASLLGCSPEAIPVVATRDPAIGVQDWQQVQEETVRHRIESGAAAIAYVLAVLRKKSGEDDAAGGERDRDDACRCIIVWKWPAASSRGKIEAIAKFYGMLPTRLIAMFERRTHENRVQLEKGVPAEHLLPRTPRSLLKDDSKWGRLGALERSMLRRSMRCGSIAIHKGAAGLRQDDERRRRCKPVCHRSSAYGGSDRGRRIACCGRAMVPSSQLLAASRFAVEARRNSLCRSANACHGRRYRVLCTPGWNCGGRRGRR